MSFVSIYKIGAIPPVSVVERTDVTFVNHLAQHCMHVNPSHTSPQALHPGGRMDTHTVLTMGSCFIAPAPFLLEGVDLHESNHAFCGSLIWARRSLLNT